MGKTTKRLISILICLGLLLCTSQFSLVFAEDESAKDKSIGTTAPDSEPAVNQTAVEAKALISALGADVIEAKDLNAEATRGDFLTLLMSLMNMTSPYGPQSPFEDIQSGTLLGNAANFAVALGVVSPAKSFNPQSAITYEQAAKMGVEALGSGQKAIALGGYPYGYLRLAAESELDMGLSADRVLTVGDMYIMLANICQANVYAFSSYEYTQGFVSYNLKEGKPFMEVYADVLKISGIIDGGNGSYLHSSDDYFEKGYVSVDDTLYALKDGVECPLGMNAEVFCKNDGNKKCEVIYIRPADNRVEVIYPGQEPKLSDGKLWYYNDNNKQQKLSVDPTAAVLYNGRADNGVKAEDFEVEAGYIEAIDNDGDGSFEVICVWEPQYLVVGGVNPFDCVIYDENYKTNIEYDKNEITFISDKDPSTYMPGDVLEVFMSNNGLFIKLKALDQTVSGVVTGLGADGDIYLDDVKYKTHPYFNEFYMKNTGLSKNASFVINDNGVVVAAKESGSSEFIFAYLDAIKEKTGLSTEIMVKIYNQEDQIIQASLDEKIRLNGEVKTSSEAFGALQEQIGNIIRYKTDSEGKIIAVNTELGASGIYTPVEDGYDVVKRYHFPDDDTEKLIYYKSFGYFVPHFTISTSTKIFCVSEDRSLDDDDRFSMAQTLGFIANDEKVASNKLKPFNVYDTGYAEVLLYSSKVEASVDVDYAPSGIVAECTEAIDDNGIESFKLVLYDSDKYSTHYISKEEPFIEDMNLDAGEFPFHMGDVIRFATSGSKIINAAKDFDGKTKTLKNNSGDNTTCHYYWGKLYSLGDSSISILKDDGTMAYVYCSNLNDVCFVDENDVYTAPKSRIATYKQVGENATRVLVKCRYSAPTDIYMFK